MPAPRPDVVGAVAAVEHVVARSALEHVVAFPAVDRIVARPPEQHIVARTAPDVVVPVAAVDPVVIIVSLENIVSRGAATVQDRFRLIGVEHEVLRVQVIDINSPEQHRSAAVRGEVDGDPVLVPK